jgi:ribonuclease HI
MAIPSQCSSPKIFNAYKQKKTPQKQGLFSPKKTYFFFFFFGAAFFAAFFFGAAFFLAIEVLGLNFIGNIISNLVFILTKSNTNVKKEVRITYIMKNKIFIYTDGSCKGNPGAGGWAAILFEEKAKKPIAKLKGNESDTTNNRMEMIAMIEALKFIHDHHLQQNSIIIYSDSNLIVQSFRLGWKRKANLDLWEELDNLNEELQVEFIWVEGHASNKWNNECDKIAVAESAKAKKGLITGRSSAYKAKPKPSQAKLF